MASQEQECRSRSWKSWSTCWKDTCLLLPSHASDQESHEAYKYDAIVNYTLEKLAAHIRRLEDIVEGMEASYNTLYGEASCTTMSQVTHRAEIQMHRDQLCQLCDHLDYIEEQQHEYHAARHTNLQTYIEMTFHLVILLPLHI